MNKSSLLFSLVLFSCNRAAPELPSSPVQPEPVVTDAGSRNTARADSGSSNNRAQPPIDLPASGSDAGSTRATDGSTGSTARPAELTRPRVEVPAGAPPTTLQRRDIVVGTGPEATTGKTVRVHYVGVNWSNHQEFDASWNSGRPFSFPLGGRRVIQGWDEGVAGMRVGGRRQLIIPPAMGYGARGAPPDIPPNETLVFVVDLLEVVE